MDIASTTGVGIQRLVDEQVGIAAPADLYPAVIGRKIVAVEVAAASGMDGQPGSRTAEIAVGPPD